MLSFDANLNDAPEPWGKALDESLHRKQVMRDQLARASILGVVFPNGRGSQRLVGIFCVAWLQQGGDRQVTGGHPCPRPGLHWTEQLVG